MINEIEKRSKEKIPNLEVYTDGSCKRIGRSLTFGGWGFIVVRDNKEVYEAAKGVEGTTNQRMELEAICTALEYVSSCRRPNEKVIIYSDSAYAINCYIQGWYINWKANAWRNSNNKPVANQDLWEKIIPYFDNFWYDFKKVEGHAGVYWNEICDQIAQGAAEKIKLTWRGKENE